MMFLSRRSVLAIAAVVDIALHARPSPVSAKSLASRHELPPRHLETMLQALVHAGLLKGVRGPRGGYELARERRRISAGQIVRAVMNATEEEERALGPQSRLVDIVINPLVCRGTDRFLETLDTVTVEDLCNDAEQRKVFAADDEPLDFVI